MRLILLGAPGSGKGTQAKKLMEKHSIPEISTGEILRKAVADGTPLGRDAKAFMERGELVPDSIVLGLIHARLKNDDCRKGFIFDGFPRNEAQAAALDRMLAAIGAPVTVVVSIDVDRNELAKRMSGRRICTQCGQVYNIYFLPPKKEQACDKCGGGFFQRDDDKEETIKKRLDIYESQKNPLAEYYRKKGILNPITGTGSVYSIFQQVCAAVEGK
jgi:adenylate kinase